ncbi:hypothetical protein Q4S57_14795 [Priestia megaterium]|uniref:DUF6414 family protein n=1 Tax=Priestia megaterium TaxID=1404 RepID=UPI0026E308E1|nr:hypothetical protein [Priestia megaterium]MDO6849226.1 hypothetical protein [Priestia megaterium]
MKDIIYLDTEIMNSMLAQLNNGLITNFSSEQSSQESETEGQQSLRGESAGLNAGAKVGTGALGGFNLNIGAKIGSQGTESSNTSRSFLEGEKDILNKTFDDYALDVLENKLVEDDLLKHGPNFTEGDLYLGEAPFRFIDFSILKNLLNYNSIQNIMLHNDESSILDLDEALKIIEKKKKGKLSAKEQQKMSEAEKMIEDYENILPVIKTFKNIQLFSEYTSEALGDLSIIRAGDTVGFIKKQFLRESPISLSFRTDKTRSVKFIVRIIGRKDIVYNGENVPELKGDELDLIPNMVLDIILGSFKIINEGDLLVTPIAIYYE